MPTNWFWLLRQTLLFNSVHLNVRIRYGEWTNCIYLLRWCSNSFLRFLVWGRFKVWRGSCQQQPAASQGQTEINFTHFSLKSAGKGSEHTGGIYSPFLFFSFFPLEVQTVTKMTNQRWHNTWYVREPGALLGRLQHFQLKEASWNIFLKSTYIYI